jgi:hypothetical protein
MSRQAMAIFTSHSLGDHKTVKSGQEIAGASEEMAFVI